MRAPAAGYRAGVAYWWCTKHRTVEEGSRRGWFHAGRLGPYATAEQAAGALDQFAERNARLDAEDRAWTEGSPPGHPEGDGDPH